MKIGELKMLMKRLYCELKQGEVCCGKYPLSKNLQASKVTLYNWENDRKRTSRKSMEILARFFDINIKTLEDFKMDRKTVRTVK